VSILRLQKVQMQPEVNFYLNILRLQKCKCHPKVIFTETSYAFKKCKCNSTLLLLKPLLVRHIAYFFTWRLFWRHFIHIRDLSNKNPVTLFITFYFLFIFQFLLSIIFIRYHFFFSLSFSFTAQLPTTLDTYTSTSLISIVQDNFLFLQILTWLTDQHWR
jgi:hypothetical protein